MFLLLSMAAPSSSSFLLLLFLTFAVESRPSPERNNEQLFHSLFDSRLSALLLAPPISDDVTEGSAGRPALSSSSEGLSVSRGAASGLVGRGEAVPQFFLDFLQWQAKMRRRSLKSATGGRGCFGIKMDRIGSVSGLGC